MSQNKLFRLISYNILPLTQRKWITDISNDKLISILLDYYNKNEKEENLNTTEKGQYGENKIENIFIKYNIPYIRTSEQKHSGDFICYNKIMIDSKNYKNDVTKNQIDKLSYDMNIRNINKGIILVFTNKSFKFELRDNIVILYVSSENDEYIWMYLEIFLNYINMIPDHLDGNITCIDSEINITLQNYDGILLKLENMKNNFHIIINELYNNNIKLKEIITNSLYIKTQTPLINTQLNDINCDSLIKQIITNIKYKELSYNTEKIYLLCNNDIKLLINYKKKKEMALNIMNINSVILNELSDDLFTLMNDININISSTQLNFIFEYTNTKYNKIIKILNKIINR